MSINSQDGSIGKTESGWMITFADLLSLLLSFFVLLFSMSTIEFENWQAVVSSMSEEFNIDRPKIELTKRDTDDHLSKAPELGLNLNFLKLSFERAIESSPVFKGATVRKVGDSVVISIPASALFKTKHIDLLPSAAEQLKLLSTPLMQIKNEIQVVGFTDNRRIQTGLYRSNWGLSVARARTVAGILTDFGYKQSITVLGYGSAVSRGVGNTRRSLALEEERIDIVILAGRHKGRPYDIF